MKYIKYVLYFLLLAVIVLFFKPPAKAEKTEYLMDTVVTITAYGKNADKAIDNAISEIKRIDELLSAYNKNSEIYKINNLASNSFVSTTEEVFLLLKTAENLSKKTDGAFDITLKPVSDLWGFGTENANVPDDSKIKDALLKTGYSNLEFDEQTLSVRFKIPGMAIDLGAIAKGYASNRAASILKENGIKNAVLDLGGNVSVIGNLPFSPFEALKNGKLSRPFVIGIQNPDGARGDSLEKVTADGDTFVITSGDYERFFEKGGKKYHHIIDPKTGYPAESGIKSATVVTKDGALGDALSTAAFVLGSGGIDKIRDLCDEIILIDEIQNIYRK